ncbi:3-hydroxyacyl-CoA dehydrogenase NAD-binding domain-containing protein [Alphaproteobacteria bacterium]|nr:3-hydroxyacyl-CoA dehydrogenase NAD-binding domain-containing protein [Alphaproteobacteria bacterium]
MAVIGAGTMGSGIAAQIANAGLPVLLLDLPCKPDQDASPAERAIQRLLKSDPPQFMHPSLAEQITTGDMEADFDKLAKCDLIIEAVIEQLPVKQALYKRLYDTVSENCVITSNTSTIPISLLTQEMPADFCARFAITHYFNPVRYMRLLELVSGAETKPDILDRLAEFNDQVLGKGVVRCQDTPGFLGNRVGVFALQVGLHEALASGIALEDADALIGRPMGIPKTGVFGLYDLIGIDLMSDVVESLATILPDGDAFHEVGFAPELVQQMIKDGYTGNKGGGGFYRESSNGREVRAIAKGGIDKGWAAASGQLPAAAMRAAEYQARQAEPLDAIFEDNSKEGAFARRVLLRILSYAASLVPEITASAQDIDDAMKLGFNWQRGPFEMIDAVGIARIKALAAQMELPLPEQLSQRSQPYYRTEGGQLEIEIAGVGYQPVSLPDGAMRFSMLRRSSEVLKSNDAASLYRLDGDLRLIEFHSKANALNDLSMQIVHAAASDHGRGIIVHNDAQHFSAGVDLNHFQALIKAQNFDEVDAFLNRFQQAVKALKYAPVPVVGAPSGLAAGGGFEVLMHCDKLVVHTNSVLGLVESGVGLVPSGGGVKESYLRWYAKTGDWDEAAWKTWMQIGYGRTGSSPQLSAKFEYFRDGHDIAVMSRDRLLARAIAEAKALSSGYQPSKVPEVMLASHSLIEKMDSFMQDGVDKGMFTAHNKVVAMAIATIIVADQGQDAVSDEQTLYDRERRAFLQLSRTDASAGMIANMLAG